MYTYVCVIFQIAQYRIVLLFLFTQLRLLKYLFQMVNKMCLVDKAGIMPLFNQINITNKIMNLRTKLFFEICVKQVDHVHSREYGIST